MGPGAGQGGRQSDRPGVLTEEEERDCSAPHSHSPRKSHGRAKAREGGNQAHGHPDVGLPASSGTARAYMSVVQAAPSAVSNTARRALSCT